MYLPQCKMFTIRQFYLKFSRGLSSPRKESSTGLPLLPATASSANCSRFTRSESDPPCRNCDPRAPRLKRIRECGRSFEQVSPGARARSSFSQSREAPYRAGNHTYSGIELLDLRFEIRDCTWPFMVQAI